MRKTQFTVELKIVRLIFEGYKYADIENRTNVAISTIKKIKKRNRAAFRKLEEKTLKAETDKQGDVAGQISELFGKRLERSQKDEAELERLNYLYRVNAISQRAYLENKRKLQILTVSQLIAISNYATKNFSRN